MRFMILLKADQHSEAGELPDEKLLTEMGKFNDELIKAGVMLAGEGLHPSARGARVQFGKDGQVRVTDGPFTPLGEVLAGFWIWQLPSMEEAVAWVKRVPMPMAGGEAVIEIRQIFEMDDFGAAMSPELREQETRQRASLAEGAG
ncbi:YciI family protein [Massilia oculi]|uniref:YciI family protein n=1 Tax=Massilia hydrophila TaxID=3044279 RepID=A0ABS7Y8P5_9BURK|nr:YciI family protein [Massilia oculi]MCA1854694.1 YciI family protein [Massilia oculi]